MKQIIFGGACGALVVLILLLSVSVYGKSARETEMERALTIAMDEVMRNKMETGAYTVSDADEFVADFCQSLLQEIHVDDGAHKDKNLQVQVDIIDVDVEKGLLSVRVTENFSYPNGRVGTITRDATAVLDAKEKKPFYAISFLAHNRPYKEYGIQEGVAFLVPKDPMPEKGERAFLYWLDADTGEKANFPRTVSGNKQYIAVFE